MFFGGNMCICIILPISCTKDLVCYDKHFLYLSCFFTDRFIIEHNLIMTMLIGQVLKLDFSLGSYISIKNIKTVPKSITPCNIAKYMNNEGLW